MEQSARYRVTVAMMLTLFVASIESTVVATAMPTAAIELGGMSIYPWVFSAYMLASTTTMSISGKLSDLYGRRPVYLVAMIVFLAASALCSLARSMEQLVALRVLQGIGAGGLIPLAFTMIADVFTFEERARVQGLFSSVWGVSSLVGPALGGFLVDHGSWRWVFLVNIPPGLLACGLLLAHWRDVSPRSAGRIDAAGAALLAGGVGSSLLLLGRWNAGGVAAPAVITALAVLSGACFAGLWLVERRAANPVLPLHLFTDRFFTAACGHGFLAGFAVFGTIAALPLFFQLALGASPTNAGASLTPLLLGWVATSNISSRLLLRLDTRSIIVPGMSAMVLGCLLMTQIDSATSLWMLRGNALLIGIGMGLSMPVFMIGVQASVPRDSLGSATSTLQFCRNIGGTFGVTVMGFLSVGRLATMGGAPVSLAELRSAGGRLASGVPALLGETLREGVRDYFVVALAAAAAGLLLSLMAPSGGRSGFQHRSVRNPAAEVPPAAL